MRVAEGIERFEDQEIVNWYLVETDEGPVAIDAGFPTAWKQIEPRVRELRAIILTHGHVDHCGFAPRAHREHGVTVYVPELDASIVRSPIPLAKSEGNPLKYVLTQGPTRRLYFRGLKASGIKGQTLREFETYTDGDVLPGGFRAIFAPGHTDGHMLLHLPERDVLFVGDTIVTKDPYTDLEGPRLVARAATKDVQRNLQSLEQLAATGASLVLTGHGEPWTGGAQAAADQARQNGAA
jgi:glyoxylase-like metal-dependent hydrolase (beta-lactamase superfamily II)